MAVTEADRSDIGRHFYNNGPKRLETLEYYIEQQISKGELKPMQWIAAMQFKALLSAEYVEQYAFAAIEKPVKTNRNNCGTSRQYIHEALRQVITFVSPSQSFHYTILPHSKFSNKGNEFNGCNRSVKALRSLPDWYSC